jgi:TonB family protein
LSLVFLPTKHCKAQIGSCSQTAQNERVHWPYGDKNCNEQSVLGDTKRVKRLAPKELKEQCLNKVAPAPSYIRGKGRVVVNILINSEGKVECVKAIKGHPILRHAAEEAAKQWSFKPVIVNGKAIAAIGQVSFFSI